MLCVSLSEEEQEKRGRIVRAQREAHGRRIGRKFSQRDAARILEINEGTYRSYEYGKSSLPTDHAKLLAAEYGISWHELYAKLPRTIADSDEQPKIKVYGRISAGEGNTESWDQNEEEPVPVDLCRPDYGALRVAGSSMLPFLHPGDLAIFKDHPEPKPNAVMAAEVEDGWVVKLCVYDSTQSRFVLRSLNPNFPDVTGSIRFGGYIVGYIRDEGPERTIRLNPHGLRP